MSTANTVVNGCTGLRENGTDTRLSQKVVVICEKLVDRFAMCQKLDWREECKTMKIEDEDREENRQGMHTKMKGTSGLCALGVMLIMALRMCNLTVVAYRTCESDIFHMESRSKNWNHGYLFLFDIMTLLAWYGSHACVCSTA